MFHIMPAR